MAETLRTLTVRQPWPWAMAHGGKDVENRTWNTAYRGALAIHAAARWDREEASVRIYELTGAYVVKSVESAVFVVVDLVDVCTVRGSAGDCECGPWAIPGQCHWRLANPRPLPEPVPCKGRLGLWSLPADVDAAVRAQLAPDAAGHARTGADDA
jgi:hypothetical protein